MQLAGLGLSTRLCAESGAGRGAVHWGALACNGLSCVVLALLRTSEAAGVVDGDGLIVWKMRTSGCGALSICGGLAALLLPPPRGKRRRPLGRLAFNMMLHVYVASLTSALLPLAIERAAAGRV